MRYWYSHICEYVMTLVCSFPTAVEETGGDSWKYSLRVSEGIKSSDYVYFSGKNQNFRGLPTVYSVCA